MASGLWKNSGQEGLQEMDPEELNPVITYRHLLSPGLGVRNPLRVIGLCDMDAFYASCEQVRLGIDPSVPLVVRQWDALIAVNYPARAYGISRMDRVNSALERCPDLRVVHVATFDPDAPDAKPTYVDNPNSETHKVSLDLYRKESKKIIDIFKEVLVDAEVERASIDEAFIDFTEPVRQTILAQFPALSKAPPEGLDIPLPPPSREGVRLAYPPSRENVISENGDLWTDLGTLVPISIPGAEPVPETGNDVGTTSGMEDRMMKMEANGDAGDNELEPGEGPSNLDSSRPSESDESVKDNKEIDVGDRTRLEDKCSPTWHDIALSIAASLMLKMRDEVKKRLGYTTSAGIARNKFLAKLVASYKKRDNQTILRNAAIPDYLRNFPFQKIRFLGGKLGAALAETYDAQTVGDLLSVSIEQMQHKFGESSIWVWEALRGIDRSEVKEKASITKSMGASKNLQHPITHPSQGAHWLRILAGELAFRLTEAREENPGLWPKTLVLSVRQSHEASRSKQGPFPFTRNVTIDYICKVADKLWADLVGTSAQFDRNKAKGNLREMKIVNVFLGFSGVEATAAGQRNIEGFFSPSGKRKAEDEAAEDSGKRKKDSDVADGEQDGVADRKAASKPGVSFGCSRCGKEVGRIIDELVDREEALRVLKMEHDDFHFAQDLARDGGGESSGSRTQVKKTKKVEPKGIARFFTQKRT